MNVGDLLQVEDGSELLALAHERWPSWEVQHQALAAAGGLGGFWEWRRGAEHPEVDAALHALAVLAANDGGNDEAAAAVLAKALLPGACKMAGNLSRGLSPERLRARQGVTGAAREATDLVTELVAAQLWIEIRTFPWRRRRNVASNILCATRVGVLREMGSPSHLTWSDRAWGRTTVADRDALEAQVEDQAHLATVTTLAPREVPRTASEELLDLLTWACENKVISEADRLVLLCLVEEASRTETQTQRGFGGLLNRTATARTAPRVGMSVRTVQRRATRSVAALTAAAPGNFSDE